MAPTADLMTALMQTMAQKLVLPWSPSRGNSARLALPPGPFFDVALQLAGDPLLCLEDLKAQYGSVVGFRLLTKPVVLVASPEAAREVFITHNDKFVKAGTAFFPNSSITGNGLLTSDGENWRRQRRLAIPGLRKSAMQTYGNAIVDRATELMERKWAQGGVVDIYADMNELTAKIVSSSLFGGTERVDQMEAVGNCIQLAFEHFARRGTSMILIPEWVPTPDNLTFMTSVRRLDEAMHSFIEERRAKLEANKSDSTSNEPVGPSTDLLTRLLEARDDDGTGMDNVALRDQLMTFFVAGQETSATMLTWAITLLAANAKAQECLVNELTEVLGDRTPTYDDVFKLKYVEAVLWETLRLMPSAYLVGRCAKEDAQLGKWDVPTGTTVLVSQYLLHRDPIYWPRPTEFVPERWLPGGGAKEHAENDSYWPFGGGPRNCIGMDFAMMEGALVLAILARQFKVKMMPGAEVPKPRAQITLRPGQRVQLAISRRKTMTLQTVNA